MVVDARFIARRFWVLFPHVCVWGVIHFPPIVQKKHISLTEDSKSGVRECEVS